MTVRPGEAAVTKQGLSKSRADLDRLFVLRPFRVEQKEVGVSWNDGQPLGAVHALDQAPTTRTSNARARPVSTRANLLRRYSSVGFRTSSTSGPEVSRHWRSSLRNSPTRPV